MTDDTRPDLPAVLSAVAIRSYVNATGWTEGPQGSCGSVFERDGFKVSVPHEDDDPDAIRMSLYRLASAEGRTLEETAAAIAEYRDAGTATKDCGCGPLEPCREHLGRGSVASVSAPAVTSPAPAPAGRSGTATGPAEGNWRERAERAEAQLAEVRQAIAAFFTHHGNSAVFALQSARDLAEGIRQVLDRAPLEALSAVCTGPDCGEQFADSETSEYLFATRERMQRLLYADGWASDPVLCPACQEEAVPVPADPEAAGQPKLPGVA